MIELSQYQVEQSVAVFISIEHDYNRRNKARMVPAACVGDDFILELSNGKQAEGKQYDYVVFIDDSVFVLPKEIFENNFKRVEFENQFRQ